MNRRHFFKDFGAKAATVAASTASSGVVYANSFGEEFKLLAQEFNQKLAKSASDLGGQVSQLSNRLDGAALTLTYQQMQLYLIFLLLVISFAIDAGMTGVWLLG